MHAIAGLVVAIAAVERQVPLVDPVEPPWRIVLDETRCRSGIFLDIGDARALSPARTAKPRSACV
jgi:hypothetical protein